MKEMSRENILVDNTTRYVSSLAVFPSSRLAFPPSPGDEGRFRDLETPNGELSSSVCRQPFSQKGNTTHKNYIFVALLGGKSFCQKDRMLFLFIIEHCYEYGR